MIKLRGKRNLYVKVIYEGDESLQNGEIQQAIAFYIQVIKLDVAGYKRFCDRGNHFKELGNKDDAINDFKKYYEFNNKLDVAKYLKGIAYYWLGNDNGALIILNQIVGMYSNFSNGYYDRGQLKQYEQAIQDFNKAIQLNPNYYMSYFRRGYCFGELNQVKEAIQDCTQLKFIPNMLLHIITEVIIVIPMYQSIK